MSAYCNSCGWVCGGFNVNVYCDSCGSDASRDSLVFLPSIKETVHLCYPCLSRTFTDLIEVKSFEEGAEVLKVAFTKWGLK